MAGRCGMDAWLATVSGKVLSACENKITQLIILTVRIQCTREIRLVIVNE